MPRHYIDSFPVPIRTERIQTGSHKGGEKKFNVVDEWSQSELQSVRHRVAMAAYLGYKTLVLCVRVPPHVNPALLELASPPFPDLDPRFSDSPSNTILQLWRLDLVQYDDIAVKKTSSKGNYAFSSSMSSQYPETVSALGVEPTSPDSFNYIIKSLSAPLPYSPTVIVIDPSTSPRLPYSVKRNTASVLKSSQIFFEILYHGITTHDPSNEATQNRRRNFISILKTLHKTTGGHNIIVSSGALDVSELRAPTDIANFCSLVTNNSSFASLALSDFPQQALKRAMSLRFTLRGNIAGPFISETHKKKARPLDKSSHDEPSSKHAKLDDDIIEFVD